MGGGKLEEKFILWLTTFTDSALTSRDEVPEALTNRDEEVPAALAGGNEEVPGASIEEPPGESR